MATFNVVDRTNKRFEGDVELQVDKTPPPPAADEQRYVDTLKAVLHALARNEEADRVENDGAAKASTAARREYRRRASTKLREQAHDFARNSLAADIAADNALVIKGEYVGELARIATSLFVVRESSTARHTPSTSGSGSLATRSLRRTNPRPKNRPCTSRSRLRSRSSKPYARA